MQFYRLFIIILLFPTAIISMQPAQTQTTKPATTLVKVFNKSSDLNREVGFEIYRPSTRKYLVHLNLQGTSVFPANIPLLTGDILTVTTAGKYLIKYSPSGRTAQIDLIIYDDRAIVVPSGTLQ